MKLRKILFPALILCLLTGCAVSAAGSDNAAAPTAPAPVAASATPESTAPPPLEVLVPDVEVTVCGKVFSSLDTEIDLSGILVKDVAALEEELTQLPFLEKVVMVDCGLRNEVMDELNRKYEDIRFVWMVRAKNAAVRTDADHFIIYNAERRYTSSVSTDALRYCTDLIALDLGHLSVRDYSILDAMPHLQYLILAEEWIPSLEQVGRLRELIWLELFQTYIEDPTPLLGCTALRDLNICYMVSPSDVLYDTLRQMTWLKRLWCSGCSLSPDQISALREELPDCEIWCDPGDESTGFTWRFHEDYYAMRDAFDMYYMDINGNTVPRKTPEEIAAMYKQRGLTPPGN